MANNIKLVVYPAKDVDKVKKFFNTYLGTEPYATVVAEANDDWLEALATHLLASGLSPALATRAAALVEAAFMGLQLDGPLARPEVVAVSVALSRGGFAMFRQELGYASTRRANPHAAYGSLHYCLAPRTELAAEDCTRSLVLPRDDPRVRG